MALFKIFRGPENELNKITPHEGYAYFTEDKGNLFIDISSESGGRKQVNAYAAQVLITDDDTEIEIDDILLKEDIEENALLVGGKAGEDPTNLTGTGALFALADKIPKFGTLPITAGGTGATDAEQARENLDVYSKSKVDAEVATATSLAYTTTLTTSGWVDAGEWKTQTFQIKTLKCGKNGNVPPVISYTSNLEEYSKIDHAEAVAGTGITFYIEEIPSNDIGIVVIDVC